MPGEFQAGIMGGLGCAAVVCLVNLVEWFSPGSDLLLQRSKKTQSPALN